MLSLSGLYRTVNRRNKLQYIKENRSEHIGKIVIGDLFITKYDGNSPPKTETIHAQQSYLRKQGLGTMPTNEISPFSVGQKEKQRGN